MYWFDSLMGFLVVSVVVGILLGWPGLLFLIIYKRIRRNLNNRKHQ